MTDNKAAPDNKTTEATDASRLDSPQSNTLEEWKLPLTRAISTASMPGGVALPSALESRYSGQQQQKIKPAQDQDYEGLQLHRAWKELNLQFHYQGDLTHDQIKRIEKLIQVRKQAERRSQTEESPSVKRDSLLDHGLKAAITAADAMVPHEVQRKLMKKEFTHALRLSWHLALSAFVVFDLLLVPFQVATKKSPAGRPEFNVFIAAAVFWTVDTIVRFVIAGLAHGSTSCRSSTSVKARMNQDPWKLFGHLLADTCLLFLDYLALIFPAEFARNAWLSVWRLLRLKRVGTFEITSEMLHDMLEEVLLYSGHEWILHLLSIVKVSTCFALFGHVMASMWYFIGLNPQSGSSWLINYEGDLNDVANVYGYTWLYLVLGRGFHGWCACAR